MTEHPYRHQLASGHHSYSGEPPWPTDQISEQPQPQEMRLGHLLGRALLQHQPSTGEHRRRQRDQHGHGLALPPSRGFSHFAAELLPF